MSVPEKVWLGLKGSSREEGGEDDIGLEWPAGRPPSGTGAVMCLCTPFLYGSRSLAPAPVRDLY